MLDIRTLSLPELMDSSRATLTTMLSASAALRVSAALTDSDCAGYVSGVLGARNCWVEDFAGEQFTLGRAWYTHLEQGRSAEYFAHAAESDRNVERFAPGLQARIRELAEAVVQARVEARTGWCAAAVHVFPAGRRVSTQGGVVHFDHEGLTPAQLSSNAPALSLVLMLQPPERGGGLRLWDLRYDAKRDTEECDDGKDSLVVDYAVGDLLVFDSYRLHQIQPFEGERDRISASLHLGWACGRWESWF